MSQDIRKYFEVSEKPQCAPMFKNCVVVDKELPKCNSNKSSEIIQNQPKPQFVNNYTPVSDTITYEAFTDGSTLGNGGRNAIGGIGVYFPEELSLKNVSLNYAKFVIENPSLELKGATNNITELLAISIAIQLLTNKFKREYPGKTIDCFRIILYTDSEYSINCITKWAPTWQKNGWQKKTGKKSDREIKNLEIIKKLYRAYTTQRIKFVHVNSHTREPSNKNSVEWQIWYGNEMADLLAKKGANEK